MSDFDDYDDGDAFAGYEPDDDELAKIAGDDEDEEWTPWIEPDEDPRDPELTAERAEWLRANYDGLAGVLSLYQLGPTRAEWPTDANHMARLAGELVGDVYWSVFTRKEKLLDGKRGGADDCCESRTLVADIDVAGPNHKDSTNLAPTMRAAYDILNAVPLRPSWVMESGGGIQAGWIMQEPLTLADQPFRERWQATVSHHAIEVGRSAGYAAGFKADHVSDIPRIMRMANTYNKKNHKMARLVKKHYDRRYSVADVESILIEVPPEPVVAKPVGKSLMDRMSSPLYPNAPTNANPEDRPGNDFNNRNPIDLYVTKGLGFKEAPGSSGRRDFWRPGKDAPQDTSATIFPDAPDRFVIFSLTYGGPQGIYPAVEINKNYDAFGLYAAVNHAGDTKSAAKDLAALGYGKQTKTLSSGSSAAPAGASSMTDVANAKRLVDKYGADLRFVWLWNQWIWWNGSHWQPDTLDKPAHYATLIAKKIWDEAFGGLPQEVKWATYSNSANGIANMVKIARTDRDIIMDPKDLDTSLDLLCVPNGTLDLRTGVLQPPNRLDYFTKGSDVLYDPSATCPMWLAFLEKFLPNPEMRAFIQRAFGYSLTGHAKSEKFFYCWGLGANGKTVMCMMLAKILGKYATTAAQGFLTNESQGSWVLAELHGRRVVFANDQEMGHGVNEQRLKVASSADQINAAFKHGKAFDYMPTHKLWVRSNEEPVIMGTDDGFWRRFDKIEFGVRIPDNEQIKGYDDVLATELPGILAWAVEGAMEWYKNGLQEPDEVRSATAAYRADQDIVGRFMNERLRFVDGLGCANSEMHEAFAGFCHSEGIDSVPSDKALANRLIKRGLKPTTVRNGRRWWSDVRPFSYAEMNDESLILDPPKLETPEIRVDKCGISELPFSDTPKISLSVASVIPTVTCDDDEF